MYYRLIKRMIETGNYKSKADLEKKIDVFYLQSKMSDDEYNELMKMLEDKEKEKLKK